ncbi:hypothetical protein MTO96_018824 [Rhipicephalus appendiculatus]
MKNTMITQQDRIRTISKAASASCQTLFEYLVVILVLAVLVATFVLFSAGAGRTVKTNKPKRSIPHHNDDENDENSTTNMTAALDQIEETLYVLAQEAAAVSDEDHVEQPRKERLATSANERAPTTLAQVGGDTDDATEQRLLNDETAPTPPIISAGEAAGLARIAEETSMPTTPLVCTAGAKFDASMPLPSDGVCDVTFYDSLHERSQLLGPHDASFEHFAALAASDHRTQYGVGLSFEMKTNIAEVFGGNSGRNIRRSFAEWRLFHYAFVNTPTWATASDLVIMLKVLKVISTLSASTEIRGTRSYTALAAYLQFEVTITDVASIFKKVYTPDIIISYGHLFEQDHMWPDCELLPPTFLKLPGSASYKYSLETAVQDLESLSDQGVNATWAVSVASFGLKYLLVYPPPGDPATDPTSGKPFTRPPSCNVTTDEEHFASVSEACAETFLGKCNYSEVLRCEVCHDTATQMMLMYDSAKALRRKLCTLKQQHLKLQYGVAVYSVEFADWSNACNKYEDFDELAAIRGVIDFLPGFVEASNVTACLASTGV